MLPHEHVREAVAAHRFMDPADWADALGELAAMTDDEIEDIAASAATAKVARAMKIARRVSR